MGCLRYDVPGYGNDSGVRLVLPTGHGCLGRLWACCTKRAPILCACTFEEEIAAMGRAAEVSKTKPKQALAEVGGDNRESLSDKAYAAILKGLFDKSIPSGAELSQTDLVRLLGTTVQPLRDALQRLEAEGLVSIQARSCIRFVKADLELSRSTYQFRSLIERAGARALAESGDAKEIQSLIEGHVALLERLEAGNWGTQEETTLDALEERVHGALISALRNRLIEITARRLKNYVTLVRLDWLTTRPLAIRTVREHLDILNACADRDADAAEAALVTHFQLALQRLIGMV